MIVPAWDGDDVVFLLLKNGSTLTYHKKKKELLFRVYFVKRKDDLNGFILQNNDELEGLCIEINAGKFYNFVEIVSKRNEE